MCNDENVGYSSSSQQPKINTDKILGKEKQNEPEEEYWDPDMNMFVKIEEEDT